MPNFAAGISRLAPEPPDARWDPETLPDDDTDDEPRWTELQLASRKGDLVRVMEILSQCENAGQRSEVANARPVGWYGQTALQAACMHGHEDVVNTLVGAGANVSAPGGNNIYMNAFEYACGSGNIRIVRLLLDAGAEHLVNPTKVTRYQGRTPIQAAAEGGHEEVVELLLDLGANVNAPPSPNGGKTALQIACFHGFVNLVNLLIKAGADVNAPGAKGAGFTALQGASRAGELELVELLLQRGADVNAPPPSGPPARGGTALHAAIEGSHTDVIKRLLLAGADPNDAVGPRRQTPLQTAYLTGRKEIMDMLVEGGAVGSLTGGGILFSHMKMRAWSRHDITQSIQ